ncbi:MAG: hypothetical protein ACJ8EY_09740 [Sphingomicrobium sp.]
MATIASGLVNNERRPDLLSGTPRAHALDRWIYVFTAASFIIITLTGFIPDSLMKVAAVQSGARPPFPLVMHVHAVLMASFLLLLLAQTWLMAVGRCEYHMRLGLSALVLAPALVLAGLVLAPTMYHETANALLSAPSEVRQELETLLSIKDNILMLQLRIGILFPLFLAIGIRARGSDAGLHKRMMILATSATLPAGIDRIPWLPTTMPITPLAPEFYVLLAISPMFVWDVIRNRGVHRAYWIWLGLTLPFAVATQLLWDTPLWHSIARGLMGV